MVFNVPFSSALKYWSSTSSILYDPVELRISLLYLAEVCQSVASAVNGGRLT